MGLPVAVLLLGEGDAAAVLVGWVETILPDWSGSIGMNDPDHSLRQALVGLPGQLGTERYGTLRARGAAMETKELLELAQTKVATLDLPARKD